MYVIQNNGQNTQMQILLKSWDPAMRASGNILPGEPRHDTIRVKAMQTWEQHRALIVLQPHIS